jgi:hypothetical protein
MATNDGGLVTVAYAPDQLRTTVGDVELKIDETTEYPFRDDLTLTVHPAVPQPMELRVGSSVNRRPRLVMEVSGRKFDAWTIRENSAVPLPISPVQSEAELVRLHHNRRGDRAPYDRGRAQAADFDVVVLPTKRVLPGTIANVLAREREPWGRTRASRKFPLRSL